MAVTFIDLFAGIGGFHAALGALGGECVYASEWDKDAARIYERKWNLKPDGDITLSANDEVINVPEHDVLVGGFPCQPFSAAGVSKKNSLGRPHGFLDATQGTLFFDVARIIHSKRHENVRKHIVLIFRRGPLSKFLSADPFIWHETTSII